MCQECREYATHIVNLEILGDTDWSEEFSRNPFQSVHDFSDYLRDHVYELVSEYGSRQDLAVSLAERFLQDVDWRELGEMYAGDHPSVIAPDSEDCPECDGSGEIAVSCATCSGAAEDFQCPDCNQTEWCPGCDGSGEILVAWNGGELDR